MTKIVRLMHPTGAIVAQEIERQVRKQRRVDRAAQRHHGERVTVRRRFHDRLHGDIAAGAGPVVDDELLTETLRQPLADQPRVDVVRAARSEADNDAHWPRRIGLRPRDPRD